MRTGSGSSSFWLWVTLGLSSLLVISCLPISALLNLFHDDSFFYMVIARNHAAGLGYSFDGINQTNGFHLLWLWMLSLIGSVVSLTGDSGIRMVVIAQSILSIGTALIYVHLLGVAKVRRVSQILFYFAFLFLCTLADIGQESALFAFLFALLIKQLFSKMRILEDPHSSADSASPTIFNLLTIFLLGALIVLSRLDSFFILGGIALMLWMVGRKQPAYALALSIVAGIALTMSFNFIQFGHPYSISSWLKSGFDIEKTRQIFIPGLLIRVLLVLGLLCAALWSYQRQGVRFKQASFKVFLSMPWSFVLTLCALLAYSAYFVVLFFEVSALGSWYFNQALGFSLFLFALSTAGRFRDQSSLSPISIGLIGPLALALLLGLMLSILKMGWAHSSDPTREMGQWLSVHTDPSAVIFQRDGAGAVSYFSQRHIINGDGLVNNMSYQVMLRSGKLCQYLADQKVQYIVSNTFVNATGLIQDFIYMWTKGVESIPLTNVSPTKALYASPSEPTYRVFAIADAATYCR